MKMPEIQPISEEVVAAIHAKAQRDRASRETTRANWTGLAGAGLFMLLGILFLVWLGTPREVPAEGQPVARLELKPLIQGEETLSEADLKGRITVLHFWGTWCETCRKEFPEFVRVYEKLKDREGVHVISVSCSRGAEFDLTTLKNESESFLANQAPDMPVYCDPAALTRAQIGQLLPHAAFTYPCTIITDERGIVIGVWQGAGERGLKEVVTKVEESGRKTSSKSQEKSPTEA